VVQVVAVMVDCMFLVPLVLQTLVVVQVVLDTTQVHLLQALVVQVSSLFPTH
jgi:hypothetical protein